MDPEDAQSLQAQLADAKAALADARSELAILRGTSGAPGTSGATSADDIHMTPANAISRVGVSHGGINHKGNTCWRDTGAFIGLIGCLVALIFIGRAAITFSPEQEAETEFVPPAACPLELGMDVCHSCCCGGGHSE